MKYILFLVVLLSGCDMFIEPDVQDTGLQFNNIDEIYTYMFSNFTQKYDINVHDVDDYWQAPKETLDRRSGDCEDYAIFIMHHLEKIGIDTTLCGVDGHAWVQIGMTLYDSNARRTMDVRKANITQSMGLKYALQRCLSDGSY